MPNVIEKVIARVSGTPATNTTTDVIPAGATNLTIITGFVAALTLVTNQFTHWMDTLLGDHPTPGSRAALAITIIAATTVVFVADLLARGYASAHATPMGALAAPPIAKTNGDHATWPTVSIPALAAADESGWHLVTVRGDQVLLVKKGKPAQWHQFSDVRGE
jgi:hypothetical protein